MGCGRLEGCPTGWPVTGSHNRTVPSLPALASSLPSGLNATASRQPVLAGGGLRRRAGRWPDPTAAPCHRRRPLASSLPSGLNATPSTPPVSWSAGGGADGLAGDRVPQPHRAVAAGAGQQLAVRAERHPVTPPSGPVVGLEGVPTGWPVTGSHSRTVPSPSALASSLPSGLNATPSTPTGPVVAGWRVPTAWPVAGSHNRTVPSASALASSLPSGLNATA